MRSNKHTAVTCSIWRDKWENNYHSKYVIQYVSDLISHDKSNKSFWGDEWRQTIKLGRPKNLINWPINAGWRLILLLIGGPICDHTLTVVFEDSDGGPGESGSQDQRGMVQFITQNQTALQDTRRMNHLYILKFILFVFYLSGKNIRAYLKISLVDIWLAGGSERVGGASFYVYM